MFGTAGRSRTDSLPRREVQAPYRTLARISDYFGLLAGAG